MKAVGIIFRKELYRVFSDPKLIFSLFILPVLTTVGIGLLMGFLIGSFIKDQEEHEPTLLVVDAPESFRDFMKTFDSQGETYEIDGYTYHVAWTEDENELESAKQQIYDGDLDVILVFPKNLDALVADYEAGDEVPDVHTFYNPSEDYSNNAEGEIKNDVLIPYQKKLLHDRVGDMKSLQIFTIDEANEKSVIQDDNKAQGKIIGMVVPYLITLMLFASVMSIGTDTFTGEKERGTMATMLVKPISRVSIVLGKLLALMLLSGISAMIYGGMAIFSLPVMYKSLGELTGQNLSFSLGQMFMLLAVVVSLDFVYVSFVALAGTLANKMQESSNYILPIYLVVMVIGMVTMFKGNNITLGWYAMPLVGPTFALKNIFTTEITLPAFLVAMASNLLVGGICSWLTSRMFNNERIMFNA